MRNGKRKNKGKNVKKFTKKRAYHFALKIIRLLEDLPKDYITSAIGKQLIRSSTSIGANITEAQAASSKKDFTNFLNHSLKSANETKFWLAILQEIRDNKKKDINILLSEVKEISNILGASIITLRSRR